MLTAFVLTGRYDACGNMSQSYSRVSFIDVLSARSAGSIRVFFDILFPVDINVDFVVDFRNHIHSRERRVTTSGRVERTDTNQAMIARFATQIAVDEIASDQNRGVANSGFFAWRQINLFDFEAAAFGPARIHSQQHLSPVGRIGSSFSRLYSQIG